MGIFQNNLMGAAAAAASAGGDFYDHTIDNSIKADTHDGYLHRTPSSAGNRATWTFSTWIKLAQMGTGSRIIYSAGSSGDQDGFYRLFYNANKLIVSSANANFVTPSDEFRDPSAWYNIVWKQGSNATTLYVNGSQIATASVSGNTAVNNNTIQCIGTSSFGGSPTDTEHLDGYFAETIMIDGTALDADSFGETKNGVWIPKDPSSLTFGTNGFYLKYESGSDLGNDSSGNNNDWTTVDLNSHQQTTDTPTNNFCTINPVYRGDQTSDAKYGVISKGNLQHEFSGSTDGQCPCTIKTPASGKWYFEYVITGGGGSSSYSPAAGIIDPNTYTMNGGNYNDTGSIQYLNNNNTVRKSGSQTGAYSGSRGSNNDVMGIAVDMDNGAFYVSKNGTFQTIDGGSQGDPTSGASRTGAGATWTPASEFTSGMVPLSSPTGGSQPIIIMNFGQEGTFANIKTAGNNSDGNGHGNFFSAVPEGYLAICTANLSVADEVDPAQTDDNYPQELFSPLLYTGNGGTNNITGLGFQPDLVWIKIRNTASNGPLVDSSRGTNKILFSQITDAEVTSANLTAFGSDGFSLAGGLASYDPNFNGNTNTYCSWNWRANGGTETTNNTGTQTSYTQTDPSGGFSIVRYAGTGSSMTVGHGLSAEPKLTIVKDRDASVNWIVYTKVIDGTLDYLFLDSHVAAADSGLTGPNSSIWNFNSASSYSNTSGRNYIMYNFTNIEGFLKVGTYGGNGDTDGTFVYTGFRPAYVMTKMTDGGAEWTVYDDKRDPHNESDHILQMDIHDAERTDLDEIDILSNGFKCLDTGGRTNQSSKHYIYLAMAKNPFKYATAR